MAGGRRGAAAVHRVLLLASVLGTLGCQLNCHNHSICGGTPATYTRFTYTINGTNSAGGFGTLATVHLHALNLSSRGITSIGPGGLSCYLNLYPGTAVTEQYEPGMVVLPRENEGPSGGRV